MGSRRIGVVGGWWSGGFTDLKCVHWLLAQFSVPLPCERTLQLMILIQFLTDHENMITRLRAGEAALIAYVTLV